MEIKFDDLTDQQCADIIAHFIKRKNVNEIIIHTKEDDIVIKKTPVVYLLIAGIILRSLS